MGGTATRPLRTGWENDTPSGDTLSLAGIRAMADRAADWARAAGGRSRRGHPTTLADSLSPCLFLNVATSVDTVDTAAAREITGFFASERPFVLVTPHPTADLRPAGLALVGHPPFLVRPAGGGTPPSLPGDVTVAEVRDPAGLAAWGRVLAAGYPVPLSPAPPALLGGRTRFWLACVDGKPAATALSHTAHGVINVEAVATLPRHRRRGLGAAVTWAATLAEPALPAVLIASDDSVGIYRRMGYLAVSRWTLWAHS